MSINALQFDRFRAKLWIDHVNWLMRRSRAVALQLFRTKSPDHLIAEAAAPERQMKRTLTAFDLTCIGIGAVIGTGIFALIGTAIAGQTFPTRLETPVLNFIQAWLSGADVVLGRAGAGVCRHDRELSRSALVSASCLP